MCVDSPCDDDQPAGETHIVLLCDENIEQGLFATVNSIVANCATPEDLVFHVGLDSSRVRETEHELQALFGDKTREIEVVDVNAFPNIAQWYHRINTKLGVKRTSNLMNYARFFVAEMFPSLAADSQNTYIFLDVDKIVYGDIREHDSQLKGKYRGATKDGQFLVVGLDDSRTVFRSLGLQSWRDRVRFLIFCKKHALDHRKMCPFNAGYYVATIGLFGKDTPQKVERLISLGLLDICQFNTQPLMMCLLWEFTHGEKWEWNVVNYGWKPGLPIDRHTMGSIHWNGPSKGWDKGNEYAKAWDEYAVAPATRARAVMETRERNERNVAAGVAAARCLSETVGDLSSRMSNDAATATAAMEAAASTRETADELARAPEVLAGFEARA